MFKYIYMYNPLYKGLNAKDFREILYILRNNQLMEMLSCGNCKESLIVVKGKQKA